MCRRSKKPAQEQAITQENAVVYYSTAEKQDFRNLELVFA